jgi:hypothetical protein
VPPKPATSRKKVANFPINHVKLIREFRSNLEEGKYVDASKYELAAIVALDDNKPMVARVLSELAVQKRLEDIATELETANRDA